MKELRNSFRPQWKRKKYGHNPQLIKRDEEIVIDYNILRQEGVIPGECLRSLALEYELSPATIDDIVKGKTKRKKSVVCGSISRIKIRINVSSFNRFSS